MTQACGTVRTLQVDGSRATIEFAHPSEADRFLRMYDRQTLDHTSVLSVVKI